MNDQPDSQEFRATRDVVIRTGSWDAACAFYARALGLRVCHQGEALIGFETGSFRLYVEPGPAHGPVFEFLVPDVDAARRRLLQAGCVLLEEDAAVPRCYLRDPFGLVFNLAAARASSA